MPWKMMELPLFVHPWFVFKNLKTIRSHGDYLLRIVGIGGLGITRAKIKTRFAEVSPNRLLPTPPASSPQPSTHPPLLLAAFHAPCTSVAARTHLLRPLLVMDENSRIKWKEDQIKCFLETCIEEVNRVGRFGGSLRKESWDKLGSKLEEDCNLKTNQKQLKNQYDYLKQKYSAWVYLKNQTGNVVYDPETNTFNISKEQWEAFSKGHQKVKSLKTTPLSFPDLCMALFDGTSATGARAHAPSSTRERPRVASSSSFTSHVDPLELDEDDEPQADEVHVEASNEPNVEEPSATPSQATCRPKKKKKATGNYKEELAHDISNALKFLVSQEQTAKEDPLDMCVNKLNTLGLETSDPLYRAAFDIFGSSVLLQKTWLKMPSDPNELKDWILRMGRRLGLIV